MKHLEKQRMSESKKTLRKKPALDGMMAIRFEQNKLQTAVDLGIEIPRICRAAIDLAIKSKQDSKKAKA